MTLKRFVTTVVELAEEIKKVCDYYKQGRVTEDELKEYLQYWAEHDDDKFFKDGNYNTSISKIIGKKRIEIIDKVLKGNVESEGKQSLNSSVLNRENLISEKEIFLGKVFSINSRYERIELLKNYCSSNFNDVVDFPVQFLKSDHNFKLFIDILFEAKKLHYSNFSFVEEEAKKRIRNTEYIY